MPPSESEPEPNPATSDVHQQAAEDRRVLRNILLWLGLMAMIGALFLVFAIWVDWS